MAVLLLQEKGHLHVHDRVGDHLENVPDSWQGLTIHQLLTHTSGLMHSWSLPRFAEIATVPISLEETLELFFDEPLQSEPGTKYEYSGLGYFLLAKIVEVVSGQSYDAFLEAEVFTPLGMTDTGPDRPQTLLEGRAAGYVRGEDGAVQNAPPIFTPILTGGGHLYSTVEDLSRWDRGLARQALVSVEAYEQMYRPELQGYAYGWRVGQLRERPTLSHGGGLPGFNAYILRLPEDDLCVVVLTNLTPGQARPVAEAVALTVLDHTQSFRDSS
jgi:CubicO group peptidase (beta-lactamase class C family)